MTGRAWVPHAGFVWNPLRNWPRNEECFCGSGIKFKACHLKELPPTVPSDRGRAIYTAMAAGEKGRQSLRMYFLTKYPKEERKDAAHA